MKIIVPSLLLSIFSASLCSAQLFIDKADSLGIQGIITSHEWGSGMSVYDFDQDGRDDLTFASNAGPMLFYKNKLEGFEQWDPEITGPGNTKHVLWADYDNDGELDVIVTTLNGPVRLYKNMGDLNFVDVSVSAGLPIDAAFNTGVCFGDYDRDGFLDLYLCRYVLTAFNPNNPSQLNRLFHNNGDGTFTDVTESSGIEWQPTLAFQGVWMDYNNDNWPDMHVIVDRNPTNRMFKNNGDGTFTDVSVATNMVYAGEDVMSNTVSDFNNDGFLDVFMTNTGAVTAPGTPSKLAMNVNGMFFSESGASYGLEIYDFGWGAVSIDADNDGWQDIYFTTPGSNANYFFMNDFGTYFNPAQEEVSVPSHYPSFSVGKGDFNNDGFYDMAVQSKAPNHPYMLMNQTNSNHFIKTTLHGTISNKFAIGSWIKVYNDDNEYVHYTLCGEGQNSQNSQHLIFGLGDNDSSVDSITITYSSGHTDTYYNVSADESYDYTEGETFTAHITTPSGTSFCAGESITLDGGSQGPYLWSTGDTTQTILVQSSGNYSLSITNEFGIVATTSQVVSVNPLPLISAATSPVLCHGDSSGSITLVNQTAVGAGSVTWSNGASGIFIDSLPAGVYAFEYQDINGCAASGSAPVLEPDAMVIISSSTPSSTADNGMVFFAVFGGTEPYQILLDSVSVGNTISGLPPGTYTFAIIDGNGCTREETVIVESSLSVYNSLDELDISFFPNPTNGMLTIKSAEALQSIEVLDVNGKAVLEFGSSLSHTYDLSSLPDGIYVLKAWLSDERFGVMRVVKSGNSQ